VEDREPVDEYVLFTNLEWVTIRGVRTFTHALVLERSERCALRRGGADMRVRGFSTDATAPTFDVPMSNFDWSLEDTTPERFIEDERCHRDGHRLWTSYGLKVHLRGWSEQEGVGEVIELATCDSAREVRVSRFAGPLACWKALKREVLDFWRHPAMPRPQFLPVERWRARE
jgi:hypothetical protein